MGSADLVAVVGPSQLNRASQATGAGAMDVVEAIDGSSRTFAPSMTTVAAVGDRIADPGRDHWSRPGVAPEFSCPSELSDIVRVVNALRGIGPTFPSTGKPGTREIAPSAAGWRGVPDK